ncbi:peroxisomal leader peptide-processing protease isoform X2 [Nomia melanderi]|uniref:peroxisomal leader peptide-processing protease isoform X2 n=1 Tax=Nomia melanderi TaxID=2448451 RepID=UPI0013044486|nr:peroxisomal leader peptide-processing protease isoform X2 [Nomia melanderi]
MDAPTSVFVSYSPSMNISTSLSHGYTGISIANGSILAHGSILAAVAQRSRQFFEFLDALTPGEITLLESHERLLDDPTFLIHRNCDSPIDFGKPLAIWKCSLLNDTMENFLKNWTFHNDERYGRLLFPVFLLIACKSSEPTETAADDDQRELKSKVTIDIKVGKKVNDILLELAKQSINDRPAKGSAIEMFSTPFGNPFFADTITRGIIGNLLGTNNCLMLIDATVLPGCEGGPVYLIGERARKTLCGMAIASFCRCRGERVDYTLAVNLLPSLNEILQTRVTRNKSFCLTPIVLPFTRPTANRNETIGTLEQSVAIVSCGLNWGTGILLDQETGTFITCAHVVARAPECKIELASYVASRNARPAWTAPAKLIYKTPDNRPYDVAVLRADFNCKQTSMKPIKLADSPAVNGEPVLSIGFPFCSTGRATISNGIISKTSKYMLQTNCCAQSGVSGGPIVRPFSLEMLGMIVCNTVSTNDSTLYTRLCMAIPSSTLKGPLNDYLRTADPNTLKNLTRYDHDIEANWNLRRPFIRSNI